MPMSPTPEAGGPPILLDARDNDVEYYYESRLPFEAAGVEDDHQHPMEPRTVRVTLTKRW